MAHIGLRLPAIRQTERSILLRNPDTAALWSILLIPFIRRHFMILMLLGYSPDATGPKWISKSVRLPETLSVEANNRKIHNTWLCVEAIGSTMDSLRF